MKTITIIGAGMMGSALAFPARENGNDVRIVGTHLDREIIEACRKTNQHPKFTKAFPEGVKYYHIEEVKEALEYFTRLQQEYPDTEYGLKATEQIVECRRTLAQREIFIANVFWGMENYQASYARFQHVVQTYPDAKEEADYARTKGEAAYLKFRQNQAQRIREHQEGSWKDWFSWL